MISIQKYCEKPDLYTRLLCKDHNKEVGMCCKFCLTLKCSKCLTANDCSGKDVLPTLKKNSWDELRGIMRAYIEVCSNNMSMFYCLHRTQDMYIVE